LGGDQQTCCRAAERREERPQGDAIPRVPVLLHAPAVEEVPGHGPYRNERGSSGSLALEVGSASTSSPSGWNRRLSWIRPSGSSGAEERDIEGHLPERSAVTLEHRSHAASVGRRWIAGMPGVAVGSRLPMDEEKPMPFVVLQEFKIEGDDRSTTNYDSVSEHIGMDTNPPDGMIIHTAGWDEEGGVFRTSRCGRPRRTRHGSGATGCSPRSRRSWEPATTRRPIATDPTSCTT
jgi:hypothetical protein